MDPRESDALLLHLATSVGGIRPFLDAVFGFLKRQTDFYHLFPDDPTATAPPSGFPRGVAHKLVAKAIDAHAFVTPATAAKAAAAPQHTVPSATATASAASATPAATLRAPPSTGDATIAASETAAPAATAAAALAAAPPAAAPSQPTPLDSYNGAATPKYTWEQTLHDVTVQVPVPANTVASDIECTIGRERLRLRLRGSAEPLLDGRFPCDARNGNEVWETVRADECTWSLSKLGAGAQQRLVSIYLEKGRESWWKSALHGDAEIDTTAVDSTRSMYEYDGETQGAIRKLMYDEEQKRAGRPTSDEQQSQEMLRKAWDAEGSPFKGTPFDPSKLSLGPPGGGPGGGA